MKDPRSKHQAPEKIQTSNTDRVSRGGRGAMDLGDTPTDLDLGVWCFFGTWILVLGASL